MNLTWKKANTRLNCLLSFLCLLFFLNIGIIAFVPEWHEAICHHVEHDCDPGEEDSNKASAPNENCIFFQFLEGHFIHASGIAVRLFVQTYPDFHDRVPPLVIVYQVSKNRWPPIAAPPLLG